MSIVTAPPFTLLLLAILGVWRVTHLLAAEDGPADLFARLRGAAGEGAFGRLLDCFYCLSFWVAAPFAWLLATSWRDGVLTWLALSGAAVLLERLTVRAAPVMWHEEDPIATDAPMEPPAARVKSDKERDHVVLR